MQYVKCLAVCKERLNICSVTVMLSGFKHFTFLIYFISLLFPVLHRTFQLPLDFELTEAYLKGYLWQDTLYQYGLFSPNIVNDPVMNYIKVRSICCVYTKL